MAYFHPSAAAKCNCPIVVGIIADGFQHHPPEHPVARRHRGRLRGHRHQHVLPLADSARPRSRCACRPSNCRSRAGVLDAEPLGDQPVLRIDHVVVTVFRKRRPRFASDGFADLAVADAVGNDDEILCRVERLARAEQFAGEVPTSACFAPIPPSRAAPSGCPPGAPIGGVVQLSAPASPRRCET